MKKFLFIFSLAAAMSVSCQKQETISVDKKSNEIRFVVNDTKAFSETTASTLQSNGLKAAAVIDADNSVMFNSAMAYSDGAFSVPDKHYYFPTSGTMSFYAVYPADEVIALSDGAASLTYTHNPDDDLIAAKATTVSKQSTAVQMNFDHILSQLSVTAKGEEATVDYKLMKVTVTAANGGTYTFADSKWSLNGTTANLSIYDNASGMAVSTSTKTAVGSAVSVMPGDVKLRAVWKCYNKGTSIIVNEKDVTIDVTLEKGKNTTLDLSLPFNGVGLKFSSTIGAWNPDPQSAVVKYKPETIKARFTVDDNGTPDDPSDDQVVEFTKGNLFWNGEEFSCEANQYDYPTSWDASHVGHFFWSKDARVAYAANYNAANTEFGITPAITDTFFAADGGVFTGFTVLSKDEWNYLITNSVHFSSALVYTSDVGDVFKGTYEQAKQQYEKGIEDESINLFIYMMLSGEEDISFDHLFDIGFIRQENKDLCVEEINGKFCVILKPDGFTGTVKESYTAAEWVTAEASGLVALPLAGTRNGSGFSNVGSGGYCWSSTPYDSSGAWYTHFSLNRAYMYFNGRYDGRSVRLVRVVQ